MNDTYKSLQKEHNTVCKKFVCDKNTSLEELKEILQDMEVGERLFSITQQKEFNFIVFVCRMMPNLQYDKKMSHFFLQLEKEKIRDHKLQVQHLVNKSKNIVRLKPRNPEEKSSGIIVKALCDFKQDQVSFFVFFLNNPVKVKPIYT